MSTKEVLTLQCGPYSNFVGAHFWNIQDKDLLYEPRAVLPKTNPGVLYREGLSLTNEVTFTPRLVSVDLKGGLGSLPRYGELYSVKDDRENTGLWDGEITKENSNEYEEKDIDESEKFANPHFEFWSDYLNPMLHSNTNVVLNEYQKNNTLKPFDIFGLGTKPDENAEEEVFETIRFFSEEADHLQGFHFLTDIDSGFGGLSLRIKDHFLDEYPRKPILTFPMWPSFYNDSTDTPFNPLRNPCRFLNITLSLYHLYETSLLTPMSLNPGYFPLPRRPNAIPGISLDHSSFYHTSALLASSLDTLSLPWRLKNNSHVTHEFVDLLSQRGRKFCSLAFSMPLRDDIPQFHTLTPGVDYSSSSKIAIQSATQRGSQTKFNLQEYLSTNFSTTYNYHNVILDEGSPVGSPYPQIFDTSMERANMITSWNSSNSMEKVLENISNQAEKLNLQKMNRFLEAGLEEDEFKEVINGLRSIAEDYSDAQYI